MLRKIGLLVWKNLLLRRRHYIVTALEILLPTLCAMILVAAITVFGIGNIKGTVTSEDKPAAVFAVMTEENIIQSFYDKVSINCFAGCFIAYAPDSSQAREVIDELVARTSALNLTTQFKPFGSEEEIENLLASFNFNTTARTAFRGAIVFENLRSSVLSYKIRLMVVVNKFQAWAKPDKFDDTDLLFEGVQVPGPNEDHVEKYTKAGFSGLQLLLDKAIAKKIVGVELPSNISVQAFPYPPYKVINFDKLTLIYFNVLPQVFVLGFIFMVPSIIRAVVSEKETGIKELLKLNGLPGWMQWLGWMVNSMIILSISITIVVFLLFWTFIAGSGAVLTYSSPTVWWVVLFLYAMSASASCFFVASFFKRPTLATTVGIILWLSTYYFLFLRVVNNYQMMTFIQKMGLCLFPNMALHLAIRVMSALEGKAVGAQWFNIAEPISSEDALSLGFVILMFFVNTVMYMFLTVYIENVLPSEYGVRKPWYYPILWFKGFSKSKTGPTFKEEDSFDSNDNLPGFETQPADLSVGIEIKNLLKMFGKNKVAVAGLSAKMYDGEIFALLGHNGAGKSTAISVLTGLFAPSGGTAIINGFDIKTKLDEVRQSLGLCPQHNMLFEMLTVIEHLQFFGQLKGLTSSDAKKEGYEILKRLQLTEKANILSLALSGGQKRKLSLGIALIGGTKVVILDEPTSGMDPEARRAIWDLLLEMRGQRTILLTTHFMEEADVLGDRIGIMAAGKLQCCGTSIFLKKYFGTGYTLKMSLSEHANPMEILSAIQVHVPNASIKATAAANMSEVLVSLPTETATTAVLTEMFSQLSTVKDQLGIKSVGLSLTTMDEVFVRVGQLAEDNENECPTNGTTSVDGTPDVTNGGTDERRTLKSDGERARGLRLAMERFMALLAKKYIYTIRKWKLLLSQLIIPIIILIITIRISNSTFEMPEPPPPLAMTLDSYKSPITLYSASEKDISSQLASTIGSSAENIESGSTLETFLDKLGRADVAAYREKYIVALEANLTNIKAMFNTIPIHAAPLAINLATNALLKRSESGKKYRIQVTNHPHPMQSDLKALFVALEPNPMFTWIVPLLFAVFMPIGLALLAASFIIIPIEEKICKAKQLQMMTGVSPLVYWTSASAWDFVTVLAVILVMTACFPIFQSYDVFTSYGGLGAAFLILLVYGYSAISFSYLVSLFASTVAGGFALVSIIHITSGIILCFIVRLLEIIGASTDWAAKFRWAARIFPAFGACISTVRYVEIATRNGKCNILSAKAKKVLCGPEAAGASIPKKYKECCDNCMELERGCFKPSPYITWEYEQAGLGFGAATVPGIGQELLYMVIMALVYQALIMLLEYGIIQNLIGRMMRDDEFVFNANIKDEDVLEESQRVSNIVVNGDVKDDALVVNNLCKSYGTFAAVSKLSFGVHHGECFGLLGVNGAGKTTAFRMLTGDEYRSFGNAFAFGNTLDQNRGDFLANIGYCPQFDAMMGVLTGREMLQLFCRLRGVPGRRGKADAEKWLKILGLSDAGNVQCQKYSGGMKRKLSAAMAMIGDPPLLFLDEPTSGVDPVSRRQFWKVLESVKNSGQSIILTSHSMEECEALCSRLGIMVNGQFQCLGGVQHLKSKFAQGYSLSVKLKPTGAVQSENLEQLSANISNSFQPCTLKDKHQSILQFQIHNASIPWDVIFKTMEDLKLEFDDIIEDYSVNETTLEEVFLSFARMQYGDRRADVSVFKRILAFQC